MRHAIVGCGSIGKRHLRNLVALGEEDFLLIDPRADRLQEARMIAEAETADRLTSYLAEVCDVAWVTAPTSLHLDIAMLAAKAGCHPFIEKPLATTADELDTLVGLVKRSDLVATVGSNWKFHPDFQRMKKVLKEGSLGKIWTLRCLCGSWLPDWHPWEDHADTYSAQKDLGGGIVYDAHELDYLTWMLGPVVEVSAWLDRLGVPDIDTEDVALLHLRFASGTVGQVQLDYLHRTYMRRYEFNGSDGVMIWDVRNRAVEVFDVEGQLWHRWETPRSFHVNDMYLAQTEHFLACLRGDEEPVTDLDHASHVVDLMVAAHASEGRPCKV